MKHLSMMIACVTGLLAGCQSLPAPAPGLASIRVRVTAEPKAGAALAADSGGTYEGPATRDLGSGSFERVDYQELDEIVVWLEPAGDGAAAGTMGPVTIEVAAKKSGMAVGKAVSVGQRFNLRNAGEQSGTFYSVSDGNEVDLGTIAAGGQGGFIVRSTGLIEILSEGWKDPVARVYAVPSRWVSVARAGSNVDFIDVPPGKYKLASWHPRLPGYEVDVKLSANQVSAATIKVGVNALPKVGPR